MADKTSSTTTIDAPPPAIMAVIADFAAYPQWASGVRTAQPIALAPDGRAEQVRFTIDVGGIKDSYVLRYAWDGDVAVRWQLAERGMSVSEMTGAYLLEESENATKVTYELTVGLAVPMIGMLKRRAEKTIIDTALKGLRNRVRQTVGESGGGK
jgi:ribosome-associated toxin RatA of RatAB toxin-antitoxin module